MGTVPTALGVDGGHTGRCAGRTSNWQIPSPYSFICHSCFSPSPGPLPLAKNLHSGPLSSFPAPLTRKISSGARNPAFDLLCWFHFLSGFHSLLSSKTKSERRLGFSPSPLVRQLQSQGDLTQTGSLARICFWTPQKQILSPTQPAGLCLSF